MIPGILIAIITFPGVIVHEAGHMLACRVRKIAVFDVCFFRFGNPVGYVVHEAAKDFNSSFLITVGPFILNSMVCMAFCFPTYLPMKYFGVNSPLSYFLMWLGISIGMHAFPSIQDGKALFEHAKIAAKKGNLLAIISFPIVVVIIALNVLSVVWADYLYGIGIGLGLPSLFFR